MKKLLLILFILITLAGFSQMNEYKIRANMYLITDSLFVIGTDTLSGTTQIDRTDTIFVTLDYLEENFVDFIDDISHYQLDEPEIETSDSLIFYMHDAEGYWRLGKGILDTSKVKGLQTFVENNSAEVSGIRGYIPKFGASGLTESMVFEAANKTIGIGTTITTEKLEVDGNIKGDTIKAVLDTTYADKTSWSEFVGGGDLWTVSGDTISPKSYPVRIDTMIMGETSDIIPSYIYYYRSATMYKDSSGTITSYPNSSTKIFPKSTLSDNGKYQYINKKYSDTIRIFRSSDYGASYEEIVAIPGAVSSTNVVEDMECSSDGRVLAFTIAFFKSDCAWVSYNYGESFSTYSKASGNAYFDASVSKDGTLAAFADFTKEELVLCKNGTFTTYDLTGNRPMGGIIESDSTYYFVDDSEQLCRYTPGGGVTVLVTGLSGTPNSYRPNYIMKDDSDNYYYIDNYVIKKTTDFVTVETVFPSVGRDVANFNISRDGKYIFVSLSYFNDIRLSTDYGDNYSTYLSSSLSNQIYSIDINRGLFSPRVDIKYEDGRMNFVEGGITLRNFKPVFGGDVVTLAYLNSLGVGNGSSTAIGDITAVYAGDGLDLGGDFGDITLKLGTPSSILSTSTNSVTSTSHTHALGNNSVTYSKLNNNIISGQTAITSGLSSTDELLLSDAGVLKRMDVSVLESYMQSNLDFGSGGVSSITAGKGLTGTSTTGNVTLNLNAAGYSLGGIKFGNYVNINGLNLNSSGDVWVDDSKLSAATPTSSDIIGFYDVSAGFQKRTTIGDILSLGGGGGGMVYPSAGIAVSTGTAWGTSITNNSSNWNTAYNDKINSLAVTGTTTKTITLTQQDGGTVSGTFTDLQGSGGGGDEPFQTLTSSSNTTWDFNTSKNANLTINHTASISISNIANGEKGTLIVTPNTSINYTLTLPSGYYYANGHSRSFTIERGTGTVYVFTFTNNGNLTIVDYATYSN